MIKKVFALLVSVIMFLHMIVYADEMTNSQKDYSYKVSILKGIGIIDNDYSADEIITRAEFAKAVAAFINAKDGVTTLENVFDDISGSDAKEEICALYINGIMNGMGEKTFNPDAPILYSHAQTVMVRALGYGQLGEGEAAVANVKRKLMKGIDKVSYELYGDMFISLIYNALYVDVAYSDINDDTIRISNENALKCFHNLEEVIGVYQANSEINIVGGDETAKNEIMVGGSVYETDGYFDSTYIGCSVVCFYKPDEDKIVAMIPDYRVDFITLRSDLILDYSDNCYLYEISSDDYKKIKVNDMADIIINNELPLTYTDDMMIPDSGYVYLTDNNSDGKYDLINIADYENFYVSGIYEENGDTIIYDRSTSKAVRVITDGEDTATVVDSDGNTKALSSLRVNTLISVMGSEKDDIFTATKIIISNKKVSGVYSQYSGYGRVARIFVNKTEYRVAPDFVDALRELTIGKEYTFSLDITGSVAAYDISFNSTNPMAVGYIIDAKENGALDGNAFIKMLTEHDKIIVYETANSIKLDDDSISGEYLELISADALGDGAKITPQLVCYNLNEDGKISRILKSSEAVIDPSDMPSEFGLYKAYDKQNASYSTYQNSFYGIIPINDNTIIYSLPADPTGPAADDEDYIRISKADIKSEISYSVEAYYFDNSQLEPNVVILYGAKQLNQKINSRSTVAVISSIISVLDDDGDTVHRLALCGTSGEEQYLTDSAERINEAKYYGNASQVVTAQVGDVVRFAINSKNEICDIQIIYDYDEETFYQSSSTAYNASERWVHGNIYRRSSNFFLLAPDESSIDGEIAWNQLMSYAFGGAVIIVDDNGRGLEVSVGSKSDVRSFIEDGVAENVIYHSYQTAPRTLIVFR